MASDTSKPYILFKKAVEEAGFNYVTFRSLVLSGRVPLRIVQCGRLWYVRAADFRRCLEALEVTKPRTQVYKREKAEV